MTTSSGARKACAPAGFALGAALVIGVAGLPVGAQAPADPQQQQQAVTQPPAVDLETNPETRPYIVVEGKVDPGTYNGYRRYNAACIVCHGPDGVGSTFAPDLTASLKRLTYDQFAETVANGRAVTGPTGQSGMPAFGTDQNVYPHLDDIYGYLRARADGAIGRGRPERIPASAQAREGGQPAEAVGQTEQPGGAPEGGAPPGSGSSFWAQ